MESSKNTVLKTIIKYLSAALVGAIFVIVALWLRDYNNLTEKIDRYRALADAFTIPGMLLSLVALLIFLTNEGSLTALGWMLKRTFQMLNPFSKKEFEKYQDYCDKHKKVTGFWFILWVGLAYLVVGIIFTILFMSLYE